MSEHDTTTYETERQARVRNCQLKPSVYFLELEAMRLSLVKIQMNLTSSSFNEVSQIKRNFRKISLYGNISGRALKPFYAVKKLLETLKTTHPELFQKEPLPPTHGEASQNSIDTTFERTNNCDVSENIFSRSRFDRNDKDDAARKPVASSPVDDESFIRAQVQQYQQWAVELEEYLTRNEAAVDN